MAENTPNIEDLKAPLLAAVGAADLALATVNEIVSTLRERAELAGDRMDDRRAVLTRLQEELPKRTGELRERLSTEELRKAADDFFADATQTYNTLVERGEAALERLKGQADFKEAAVRVESYVELTQEALGNVSAQTRAVGERAAKLVGVELPVKEVPVRVELPVKEVPAEAVTKVVTIVVPVKKAAPATATAPAPAKKAPVKRAPVKRAPVKRAPVKTAAPVKAVKKVVKKAAPAKKAPAKKVTQK